MTRTAQLDAHYAVIQLDAIRQHVALSFQPTVDLLIAEVRERDPSVEDRQRLRALLDKYRGVLLDFDAVVVALRGQCGTDRDDLPDGDDDVTAEVERIRRAHAADKLTAVERERERERRWCEVDDALYAARHGSEA
jgi:hypothetical protein